jgi:hypothetical protein
VFLVFYVIKPVKFVDLSGNLFANFVNRKFFERGKKTPFRRLDNLDHLDTNQCFSQAPEFENNYPTGVKKHSLVTI